MPLRRIRACLGEYVREPVIHAIGDEPTHREECDQLDQRLESDGSDHALMPLRSIEVTRPEEDREQSEQHCHPERRVDEHRHRGMMRRRRDLRVLHQQRVAAGDRLQLQRDVRQDADNRDDRHEPGEERALAVSRRHEVGERRDAVRPGDADDLADHEPPQGHHQGRPDVDGKKADAVGGRAPHAAIECPGCRVYAERQRIDVRIGDDRAPGVCPLVAVVRDREEQAEVCERDRDDEGCLQHGSG